LIILTAAHNHGRIQKMMQWPLAQYLGEISYSIYMMQGLWLSLYWMGLDSWLLDRPGIIPDTWTLVSLVMSLLFVNIVSAAGSHHNIEIPMQQRLRKIKFK